MTDFKALKTNAGKVSFKSSNVNLDTGFNWAKKQALEYAHFGEDPVGLWYEAALPGRNSFCIRDICHQSIGANILGLRMHTKNMLRQFIINIHSSRDYCTYWEITSEGKPTSVDYDSDEDFWYNLPANFDLIRSCYLQYLWTGDDTYVFDEDFNSFYSKSACEYVNTWDKDKDNILEHYSNYGRRGIASYNESDLNQLIGGDMIAIQYAGLTCYAELLKSRNKSEKANEYIEKAQQLADCYLTKWWNETDKRFYGAMKQDRSFYEDYYSEANFFPLFYGIVTSKEKLDFGMKDTIKYGTVNVEGMTYLPEIYYRYGYTNEAYKTLLKLIDPTLPRREYPEVSFCVISTYIMGLMGINAEKKKTVSTLSNLNSEVEWAEINDMPIFQNEVSIKHIGQQCTELINRSGESIHWKAAFHEHTEFLFHNGKQVEAISETGEDGDFKSFIIVKVEPGEKHLVSLNICS